MTWVLMSAVTVVSPFLWLRFLCPAQTRESNSPVNGGWSTKRGSANGSTAVTRIWE